MLYSFLTGSFRDVCNSPTGGNGLSIPVCAIKRSSRPHKRLTHENPRPTVQFRWMKEAGDISMSTAHTTHKSAPMHTTSASANGWSTKKLQSLPCCARYRQSALLYCNSHFAWCGTVRNMMSSGIIALSPALPRTRSRSRLSVLPYPYTSNRIGNLRNRYGCLGNAYHCLPCGCHHSRLALPIKAVFWSCRRRCLQRPSLHREATLVVISTPA